MNGQMKSYSDKQNMVNQYILNNNLYDKSPSLNFDLRGYASYIKNHHLNAKDITPDILNKFVKK